MKTEIATIDLTNVGNHTPIGRADMRKWRLAAGEQADPTGRLLSCDMGDCWAAEEWAERGTYDGQRAERIYLFSANDITGDDGEPLEADCYPWDTEHTARIVML